MKNRKVVKLLAVLAGVGAVGVVSAQPSGPVNGDAEAGAQLYYDYSCYGCHGFSGYGRQDLNNTGSPFLMNEEVFRAFLRARADVAPLLPSTSMPNYPANSLTDAMVRDLYAYVRSMPANTPEVADIPTLRAILDAAERRTYRP